MPAFKRLAVALDGSRPADQALGTAIELANTLGASLTLVGVVPVPPTYAADPGGVIPALEANTSFFRSMLAAAEQRARDAGVRKVEVRLLEGPIADGIVDLLREERIELLVMGARGLSAARRILLGSVSDAVLHHAPCSVLVVRPAAVSVEDLAADPRPVAVAQPK